MREFFKAQRFLKNYKNLFSPQRNAFFVVYISEGTLREEGEVL